MAQGAKVAAPYPALVGRVLATRRESRGWDQSQLAEAVGVSQSTWSRIENGDSALGIDQLAKAAQALGAKPADILIDADKASEQIERAGIVVTPERAKAAPSGFALLFGAALTALMVKALTEK